MRTGQVIGELTPLPNIQFASSHNTRVRTHTHMLFALVAYKQHYQKILNHLAQISGRTAEGCHMYLRNYLMMTHKNLSDQTQMLSLADLHTIKGPLVNPQLKYWLEISG